MLKKKKRGKPAIRYSAPEVKNEIPAMIRVSALLIDEHHAQHLLTS